MSSYMKPERNFSISVNKLNSYRITLVLEHQFSVIKFLSKKQQSLKENLILFEMEE